MRNRSGTRWLLSLTTIVGTLGLGGIFVAQGLSTLLTTPSSMLSDAARADRNTSALRGAVARQVAERVLIRNIFDSATGPLAWDAADESSAAPAPVPQPATNVADAGAAPRCDGGLRLVASVVNSASPERSFAALRRNDRTQLVALGGQLDELTLFVLRPARAYLHAADGSLCFVPLFLGPGERPKVEAPAPVQRPRQENKPAKPKGKPPLFAKEELERGVTSLGRGGYSVSRDLVLRALSDPGAAGAGAQFRAVERDGHTVGMEVRAVRNGSPLKYLGIQAGDVVRGLNGADLTSPVGLLGAMRSLRESDSVTLLITRDGAPKSIQYLLD